MAWWLMVDPVRLQIEERRAKLQLAGEAAAGGLGNRLHNPEFQHREVKPQITD